jgi:hypothetical protein
MIELLKKLIAKKFGIPHLRTLIVYIQEAASGKKAYIGIAVYLINGLGDFLNQEISPEQFFDIAWQAFMLGAARSAVGKVEIKSNG